MDEGSWNYFLMEILMKVYSRKYIILQETHLPTLDKHLALTTSNVSRNRHRDKNNCISLAKCLKLLSFDSCFQPVDT